MKKGASHACAFEEATGIWEEARNLPRPWLLPVGATVHLQGQAGVGTNIGEQRVLALEDGTRVILDTDTRVVVSYDGHIRSVELKEGEALFEVAKRANWPFVVTAGDRRIEALGTSFVERRHDRQLAVFVLGRTRGADDRRIDNRAGAHLQPFSFRLRFTAAKICFPSPYFSSR
jgi:transmembrane sensor